MSLIHINLFTLDQLSKKTCNHLSTVIPFPAEMFKEKSIQNNVDHINGEFRIMSVVL